MSYTKTNWENGATPAINAENLNHMEQGIYAAHENMPVIEIVSVRYTPSDVDDTGGIYTVTKTLKESTTEDVRLQYAAIGLAELTEANYNAAITGWNLSGAYSGGKYSLMINISFLANPLEGDIKVALLKLP